MNSDKINIFLASKSEYFPAEALPMIREHMENASDSREMAVFAGNYVNPTLTIILSILVGGLGIDRFLIGDIGKGIGKLITCCFCGIGVIWVIIDWFLIMNDTRQKNLTKLLNILSF